jgi:hypothetical protein
MHILLQLGEVWMVDELEEGEAGALDQLLLLA